MIDPIWRALLRWDSDYPGEPKQILYIGHEAVERKIKAGHPYGTAGCLLGGE